MTDLDERVVKKLGWTQCYSMREECGADAPFNAHWPGHWITAMGFSSGSVEVPAYSTKTDLALELAETFVWWELHKNASGYQFFGYGPCTEEPVCDELHASAQAHGDTVPEAICNAYVTS